eukprot:TRINITY_DN3322_c0_g1_i1.p1 TRINITY_DN3322_c0_g1~~TRINITY_DN3322_c0_g1_i1.p1  ORF type:complete len:645 (+),score=151.54 TRINITY_DN3322_c0_g1_i1:327-2261(+)
MSNQKWMSRQASNAKADGKDGKAQSFRGKLEFGSPIFRISIGTVVVLSLMTPVLWMCTGNNWQIADDITEKLGAAIIPGNSQQSLVGEESMTTAGVKSIGEKQVLQDDDMRDQKAGGVKYGGGRVALEAGDDRAELEEKIEKKKKLSDQWSKVKRNKARPERFWESKIGSTVESGKGLVEYAMEHGHESLGKSLKEQIERCLAIRLEYKKGGDWPGEVATINAIRVLELQVVRAKEYKSNMQVIGKMKKDMESVREKVLSLQRERNILDLAAAKALPRGLHCLSMRLTVEHNSNPKVRERLEEGRKPELDDPFLYHYALFSDNILAAAVVVNSTITNALEPEKHVFHIVTDSMNRNSFDTWFTLHPPRTATLEVQSVEDFKFLNASYCPVLEQLSSQNMKSYYFAAASNNANSQKSSDGDSKNPPADIKGAKQAKYRNPKYLSMLNHLRFYLPEMYPKLDKILFLDDDIVVQKDLTGLWKVDLNGNVNGAVFTCVEDSDFHRLHKYLNFSHPLIMEKFDPQACGWAYGMNVFDLDAWRDADLTSVYHYWQRQNHDRTLWRLGTLPPGLLTYYNLTQPLEKWWHVLGLGYNPSIDEDDINTAAVIHYNGNQKPWLDIAMKHFRGYWAKYIASGDEFIQACNLGVQ